LGVRTYKVRLIQAEIAERNDKSLIVCDWRPKGVIQITLHTDSVILSIGRIKGARVNGVLGNAE